MVTRRLGYIREDCVRRGFPAERARWLDFPALYMAYTLVRGFVSHWYPYYFVDVDTIGLSRSLIHAAALLLAFLGLGLLFVAIGRWTARLFAKHATATWNHNLIL